MLALLVAAAALRFHDLPARVMHTDEAVHAVTVGRMLAGEAFRYDPKDFHGPVLHYATLPVAWLRGQRTFADLDEWTLRGVPAAFGVLLVFLPFAFRRELGGLPGAVLAAWFTALCPMMVFFSGYYIMEMLFVGFLGLFGLAAWRWAENGSRNWLLVAGVCLGVLHATKETFVLHVAAMAVAAILAGGRGSLRATPAFLKTHWKEMAGAVLVAFLVSAVLLTHGFRNPGAVLDGLRTYLLYFQRADGSAAGHAQPWSFYFSTLFAWKPSSAGFLFSEIGLLALGTYGGLRAFLGRHEDARSARFQRITALYTLITVIVYSLIPYKTPWSFLGTVHGLAILSATGLAAWAPRGPIPAAKRVATWTGGILAALALAAWTTHALACTQRIRSSPADPAQPYVYGHTSQGFLALVAKIDQLEACEGRLLELWVAEEENGWPMPWYRRHALGHNRYTHDSLPFGTGNPDVAAVSREWFGEAAQALMATHRHQVFPLRPWIDLHVFFRNTLQGMPPDEPQQIRSRSP